MLSSQLYKIDNYAQDYFHYGDGQWEVIHKIKKVVLDGTIDYDTYNIMTNSKEIRPLGSAYYSMVILAKYKVLIAINLDGLKVRGKKMK